MASVEDADELARAWNYKDTEEVRGETFIVANDDEFADDSGHGGMFLQLTALDEYVLTLTITGQASTEGAHESVPSIPVKVPDESTAHTPEGSERRTGRGKGLFTGALNYGIEPRHVGRDVLKEDFETRSGTEASMGLLAEVIDALELEQGLDVVPSAELAADLRKLAMRVSYHFVIPFLHNDV